jgi:hypothetical protein
MRSFVVSALVAATVLGGAAVSLPAAANAATRHYSHHRAPPAPYVHRDPYRSFNQFDPPAAVPVVPADPYSTYRWPPSGGAT